MPYTVQSFLVKKGNTAKYIFDTADGLDGIHKSLVNLGEAPEEYEIVEVPCENDITEGDDIRMFTSGWKFRPLQELVDDGYKELLVQEKEKDGIAAGTVLEKIVDNQRVKKTKYELVKEGARVLQDAEYLDDESQEVKKGDDEKLLEVGRITQAEYTERLAAKIRQERDDKLSSEVDPVVTNPLRWSDLSPEEQTALSNYRKALLDITDQEGFPETVNWPEL